MSSATLYDRRNFNERRTVHNKEPLNLLTRKYLIARIYVAFSIFFSMIAILFDAKYKIYTPDHVLLVFYFAFVLSCFAIIDSIVNDFAPDRFCIMMLYDNRHLIYMGLALISFSISSVILNITGTDFSLLRFWLDGVIAASVAILDIFARHRETRK